MNESNKNPPETEKCKKYLSKSFNTIMSFYILGVIIFIPLILSLISYSGEIYFITVFLMIILISGVVNISIIVFSLIGIFYGIQAIRKNEEDYKKNIWGIFSNLFFILLAALTVYGAFLLKDIFTK